MRFLSTLLLSASLVFAADSKPKGLDSETFFDMETVSNPAISPDGKTVVFSRGWVDKMKDQARSNLWVVNSDGSRLRELTSGAWRDSNPVWSPDGQRVAFLSDRDGTSQLHVMWFDNREVLQLTRVQRPPSALAWSPDGKWIAFTQLVPDEDPILNIKMPKKAEGAQWAKTPTLVDRLSWGSDGLGPLPRGFTHVFVVDAITGGVPKQMTDGKYNHRSPAWSADGKTIFISAIRKPDADYLRNDSEIYVIDVAGGSIKPLTDRKGPDMGPEPSPNGKWIAYLGYDDQKFTNHIANLYLMDADGSNKRTLAANLPSSPGSVHWAAGNAGVYYTMEEKGSANLFYQPLNGPARKITDGVQMIAQVSVAKTEMMAAVRSGYHEPGSLVTFFAGEPRTMKKVVDVNQDVLTGRALGGVEELWYESKDGWKIQGWLVKPIDFDPAKKYPMVLYIHGGPWSMYSVAFSWAWQDFAANGYAVLYVNPRGSTGYGQEFVNGIQYSYPGKDYDDLMAGVDAAVKKGFVDERNLFVCGGSGGGVLTAWIVGHTDRFRAAVSMRPVINWHSFVGNTDGPSWYDQFKKYPWEDPMEYAVRSPLNYVANVKTPTMVMTGEADLRTPITQSEEFYRALKVLKKQTLLVRMPEEFHGWRRPSHQLMQQLYLLAWFEKYRVN